MEKNEKVKSYGIRMEGSLNQIRVKFSGMISDVEAETKLRDRLFYGVLKTLQDSIRYLYDNPVLTYTQSLVAARKMKAEVSEGKSGTMTVKAKSTTTNDELITLKQQVSDLVAVVKTNHVRQKSKGATIQQNSSNNENQANRGTQILGGTGQQSSTARPSKNNQTAWQCYHCRGWGHMAKECTMPLSYIKEGSLHVPFLQKSKRSRRVGSLTDPAQTNPFVLKAVKECYHNPDPIACLIGKVNEAPVFIDNVECLDLVDSGAQISTIIIEFVRWLRLKVHKLDRMLKFETTGGGDIPYMGYVEVNLKIPEIKAFHEDVLMLVIDGSEYAQ